MEEEVDKSNEETKVEGVYRVKISENETVLPINSDYESVTTKSKSNEPDWIL